MTDITADLYVADTDSLEDRRQLDVADFKTPATGAATQTTLAAVLAKLSADPASQTTLAAALVQLTAIAVSVDGLEGFTDGVETKLDTLHTDIATTLVAKNEQIRALLAGTLAVASANPSALGNKSLAMTGSAVNLSSVSGGIPGGATSFLFVPTVPVRYTDDGTTTPTASVGIPVAAGQGWEIDSTLSQVKFWGASGQVDGGFYS